ncbi:uncharacterized protein LOC114305132 [Camellia sinensis]|uniref:uncharacterized protein LOC114305132 n=1 Tax=Camellia sinensis TaxID=4442 RepID=UPI0010355D4C|nr:uncharacterized protein LOC114305132 [Camellia sinensis]
MEAEEARQRHKRLNYVESKGDSGSSKKSKSSFSLSSQSMPQLTKSSGFVSMRRSGSTGPNRVICFRCGQQCHKASNCNRNLSRQQQAHSQSPAQGRGQSPAYYYCGQSSHIKRSCSQLIGRGNTFGPRNSGGYRQAKVRDRGTSQFNHTYVSHVNYLSA